MVGEGGVAELLISGWPRSEAGSAQVLIFTSKPHCSDLDPISSNLLNFPIV